MLCLNRNKIGIKLLAQMHINTLHYGPMAPLQNKFQKEAEAIQNEPT